MLQSFYTSKSEPADCRDRSSTVSGPFAIKVLLFLRTKRAQNFWKPAQVVHVASLKPRGSGVDLVGAGSLLDWLRTVRQVDLVLSY